MSEDLLSRARVGDEDAFGKLVEPYRRELQLHCYRILGSVQDAEDLLQETLLAAWRGLDRFEGRASLRAWLYRIATNRCLNALRDRKRRPQEVSSMVEPPEPTSPSRRGSSHTPTSCSRDSRTPPQVRRHATRRGSRSDSHSWRRCNTCRLANGWRS